MESDALVLDGGRAPKYATPIALDRFCRAIFKQGGKRHLPGERCTKFATREVVSEVLTLRCCTYHAEQVERQLRAKGITPMVMALEEGGRAK